MRNKRLDHVLSRLPSFAEASGDELPGNTWNDAKLKTLSTRDLVTYTFVFPIPVLSPMSQMDSLLNHVIRIKRLSIGTVVINVIIGVELSKVLQ